MIFLTLTVLATVTVVVGLVAAINRRQLRAWQRQAMSPSGSVPLPPVKLHG